MKRYLRLGLALLLLSPLAVSTGCSVSGGVKYTHDSSIPDYYDKNESNMAGPYVRVYLCKREYVSGGYCPEIEGSAEWEFHNHGNDRTYGSNPVGQVEIRFPMFHSGGRQ